ncbi:hypothetical protein RB4128 [Rhodopirellula baltica SH 1]|uniref:Uncharacterized protein n=1 Tax=Rhodopirellula baltica (strain DSM 10527 / NCIMB 13988 / SH1) TaxID=243090 RepID=Q7UT40_RHOBA|nr:hypothetical protein RB4128 [Rhodopirellula baltica SH 1]
MRPTTDQSLPCWNSCNKAASISIPLRSGPSLDRVVATKQRMNTEVYTQLRLTVLRTGTPPWPKST